MIRVNLLHSNPDSDSTVKNLSLLDNVLQKQRVISASDY